MKHFSFRNLKSILTGFGILLGIYGCIKNEDFQFDKVASSNWDPDFAAPLINSSLGINDLTGFSNSTIIETDSNNFVHLIYTGNIYSVFGYEFLPLLSQTNTQTITLSPLDSTALYQTGTFTKNISFVYSFAVANGEQLDSMILRTGQLDFGIQSQIPHDGQITISIPDATFNGIPYTRTLAFNTGSGVPVYASSTDNLSNYKFNFTGNGGTNELRVNYSITFTNNASSTPSANRNFFINCDLNNLQFQAAYGNFGQRSLSITGDSSKIELFNNSLFGNISFKDPQITFNILNSFGLPINAQMTSLYSISNSGVNTNITGAIPNPLPVPVPASLGQTANSSFSLDKNNSNLSSIMDQNPRYIAFNVDALSNSPVPAYNFMSDSSRFAIDVRVNLPLLGSANGFTVEDTADFELEKIEEVQKAIFRINADNGFPANAFVQIYFTDSAYTVLDSLLSDPADFVIESGLLDINGVVIYPNRKSRDEVFDKQRLSRIYQAKKLIIIGVVNTQNAPVQQVPIYSTYKLNIKIGVHAFLNIDF